MRKYPSIWNITPDTAHPRAKELLGQSIIWNYGDEDSPLGNDTGADTFAAYLDFRARQHTRGIQDFISEELAALEIPDADWDELDFEYLKESLSADKGFCLLRRDDFIIGLAFAQLLVEGTVESAVRSRAMTALRRQETDIVLSFRGGGGEVARKKQLAEFQRVLKKA